MALTDTGARKAGITDKNNRVNDSGRLNLFISNRG